MALSKAMQNRITRWGPNPVDAKPGDVLGLLTVLGRSAYTGNRPRYICRCACGTVKPFSLFHARWKAKRGGSPSCGCTRGGKPLPDNQAALNRIYDSYKRHSKNKGRRFDFTVEDFRSVVIRDCHYCGRPPQQTYAARGGNFVYNGIDRLNSEWGYSFLNSVPCCFPCNKLKGSVPYVVFIKNIRKIYEFLKLGEVAKCSE